MPVFESPGGPSVPLTAALQIIGEAVDRTRAVDIPSELTTLQAEPLERFGRDLIALTDLHTVDERTIAANAAATFIRRLASRRRHESAVGEVRFAGVVHHPAWVPFVSHELLVLPASADTASATTDEQLLALMRTLRDCGMQRTALQPSCNQGSQRQKTPALRVFRGGLPGDELQPKFNVPYQVTGANGGGPRPVAQPCECCDAVPIACTGPYADADVRPGRSRRPPRAVASFGRTEMALCVRAPPCVSPELLVAALPKADRVTADVQRGARALRVHFADRPSSCRGGKEASAAAALLHTLAMGLPYWLLSDARCQTTIGEDAANATEFSLIDGCRLPTVEDVPLVIAVVAPPKRDPPAAPTAIHEQLWRRHVVSTYVTANPILGVALRAFLHWCRSASLFAGCSIRQRVTDDADVAPSVTNTAAVDVTTLAFLAVYAWVRCKQLPFIRLTCDRTTCAITHGDGSCRLCMSEWQNATDGGGCWLRPASADASCSTAVGRFMWTAVTFFAGEGPAWAVQYRHQEVAQLAVDETVLLNYTSSLGPVELRIAPSHAYHAENSATSVAAAARLHGGPLWPCGCATAAVIFRAACSRACRELRSFMSDAANSIQGADMIFAPARVPRDSPARHWFQRPPVCGYCWRAIQPRLETLSRDQDICRVALPHDTHRVVCSRACADRSRLSLSVLADLWSRPCPGQRAPAVSYTAELAKACLATEVVTTAGADGVVWVSAVARSGFARPAVATCLHRLEGTVSMESPQDGLLNAMPLVAQLVSLTMQQY
jgi:hypothetical protein